MNYKTRAPFQNAAYVEGQRNFTYFDRSLTSGLTDVVIESPGDFLYIDQASTGVVSVELNMRQGGTLAPILLAAGGSIECDFASIKINATAQLNKTVRLIVGNGARIKGGANVNADSVSISIVDGGNVRTINDKAFAGIAISPASPGLNSQVQILAPASAARNFYVNDLIVSASAAAKIHVQHYGSTLPNLYGVAASKQVSGVASLAQMRYSANAGLLGSGDLLVAAVPANESVQIKLTEPIFIPVGYSLLLTCGTVNTELAVSAQLWIE